MQTVFLFVLSFGFYSQARELRDESKITLGFEQHNKTCRETCVSNVAGGESLKERHETEI